MTSWQKSTSDPEDFPDSFEMHNDDSQQPSEEEAPVAAPAAEYHSGPPPKVLPIDRMNRIDLVAYFFSQGKTIPQIVKILEQDYGVTDINRETPYHDLAYAASHRWLSYNPPRSVEWTNEIRRRIPGILETSIPNWGGRCAVISESAELVGRSIYHIAGKLADEYALDWEFPANREPGEPRRSRKNVPGSDDQEPWWKRKYLSDSDKSDDPQPVPMDLEIRLGFSGGDTMGKLASHLGQELESKLEDWEMKLKQRVFDSLEKNGQKHRIPKGAEKRRFKVRIRLMLVNMVSGFGTTATSHPIAFLTSMLEQNKTLGSHRTGCIRRFRKMRNSAKELSIRLHASLSFRFTLPGIVPDSGSNLASPPVAGKE